MLAPAAAGLSVMNGPATQRPQFSIALLFYNEEENVVPVVAALRDALARAGFDFQLVLVNNGSHDRTAGLIRELAAGDRRLKPVTVEENRGYGWGAIRGLQAADGEWVGFMAGDGQVDPSDVIRLLREASCGCDLIKVRRARREDGVVRCAISYVYVMTLALLFDLPFYDMNATPRIFRRKWLSRLRLTSVGWFLDAETLIKGRRLGMTVKEIPILFKRRAGGRSHVRPLTVVEFLMNIARYRLGREIPKWKQEIRSRS